MTDAAKSQVRAWWLPTAVAVLAIVIAINYALLIPSLQRQAEGARAGQDARTTQQRKYPVTVKAYEWIESQGGITKADLECMKSTAACPPLKQP